MIGEENSPNSADEVGAENSVKGTLSPLEGLRKEEISSFPYLVGDEHV